MRHRYEMTIWANKAEDEKKNKKRCHVSMEEYDKSKIINSIENLFHHQIIAYVGT